MLGLDGKEQIEEYGLEPFIKKLSLIHISLTEFIKRCITNIHHDVLCYAPLDKFRQCIAFPF